MSILDLVDKVSSVVNEFKVGRRLEVESLPDLVPCCLQLNQMLEMRKIFQMNELVVRDIDILKILVFLNTL